MRYTLALIVVLFLSACSGETKPSSSASIAAIETLQSELPVLSGMNVWEKDHAASSLSFEAFYNGNFTASFGEFATQIRLNPEEPETGEIYAIVNLGSIRSKDDDVEANVQDADWFNTDKFPYALFSSTQIEKLEGNNYAASGDMTLKGIAKPVRLVFSLDITGDRAIADGGFEIDRRDFNVGTSDDFKDESWVKFPVAIRVHIEAKR